MNVASLQSQLAYNRQTITFLQEQKIVLKAAERVLFRLSDKENKNTHRMFLKLNQIRDEMRYNNARLKNLAELQIVLKRAIRKTK